MAKSYGNEKPRSHYFGRNQKNGGYHKGQGKAGFSLASKEPGIGVS